MGRTRGGGGWALRALKERTRVRSLLFGRPRGGPQGRPSAAKRRRPPPPLGKGGSGRRLRPRGMGWETLRVHGSLECGQERVCVQRGVV